VLEQRQGGEGKDGDGLTALRRLGKVADSALLWRLLSAARDHPTKQNRYQKTTFFQPE
jgi:hypothetical protein